jgi:hypothetical protein
MTGPGLVGRLHWAGRKLNQTYSQDRQNQAIEVDEAFNVILLILLVMSFVVVGCGVARYGAKRSHTVPICVGIDKLTKANHDIEACALLAWSLLE